MERLAEMERQRRQREAEQKVRIVLNNIYQYNQYNNNSENYTKKHICWDLKDNDSNLFRLK